MHRSHLVFILAIALNTCFAQVTIQGKVINHATQEPIPYVNIGIVNSNVGTLSNTDGTFLLIIPEPFRFDTVTFSALGFAKRVVPIIWLRQQPQATIWLAEKSTMLQAVAIHGERQPNKIFTLGNAAFRGGIIVTDTTYAGRSIALLIDNKSPHEQKDLVFPVYLETARLRIMKNNLSSMKFRIRILDVDAVSGKPGKDLLARSMVVESAIREGWLKFDLSEWNIQIAQPFYLVFEQILDVNDRTRIANGYRDFIRTYPQSVKYDTVMVDGKPEVRQIIKGRGLDLPGTFIGVAISKRAAQQYTSYIRETSLGEWQKVGGIVAATVTLSNQRVLDKPATPQVDCIDNAVICEATERCKSFMDDYGLTGIQVSVAQGGKRIWSGAWGYADLEHKVPVTASTRFRINSISKSMTAVALVKLVSAGKLDLDAPVQQYVPTFPVKKYPITTRQLAGHLAGIRDYKEDDLTDLIRTTHYESATQAIQIFQDDTLLFKPNTRFHYSTFGWNLIGAVTEGASGESYLTHMEHSLWQPLGLVHTCGDDIRKHIPDRSRFYDLTGTENDLGDLSYKYAGGGLLSTADDLVTWGNEILNGTYLNPQEKKLLFTSQKTTDQVDTGYGLGWYVGKDKNGHTIWYHAGDSFSSSSHIIIYPDDNLVIAFLCNSQHGAAFDLQQIGELFYQK